MSQASLQSKFENTHSPFESFQSRKTIPHSFDILFQVPGLPPYIRRLSELQCGSPLHAAKDQALENPVWEQLQSKQSCTKRDRSPTVQDPMSAKRSKSTKKNSRQVIEESGSHEEEELAPPPPSLYKFKPPPRVLRQQYEKGRNLTSKLSEDSDSDGDPDVSDAESIESRGSGLSEPDEFVTQALFDEVPAIVNPDRRQNKQTKAVSLKVKAMSTREKKCAMETPKWNESVSPISKFDSPLITADSSIADESDVPVKKEDAGDV
ncbi:hypothetical protein P692DRAFT_20878281 [Suillus brevipes Sb2]|nr:hypothetical protein P692DRAFT_20878281 [Suillus brevipes Sb2]